MNYRSIAAIFIFFIADLMSSIASAATPQILVTLKPLHSLVSGLTAGVNQPALLLDGMQSPHDYQLKPSERRLLESSDVIIYASDNIESFIKTLHAGPDNQQLIALDTLPGMPLLPARGSHADSHGDNDGHIWLSPVNAMVMVKQLAGILVQLDPANADKYLSNRDRLSRQLALLHTQISQQLFPVRNQPFLQFHDALQYFERDFDLKHGIAVTSGAEHAPGARHIRALQQQISHENIQCFLYEPPQAPKLLQTLDVNHNARMQALEIHGSQMQAGEELYFDLINDIAEKIKNCLQHQ